MELSLSKRERVTELAKKLSRCRDFAKSNELIAEIEKILGTSEEQQHQELMNLMRDYKYSFRIRKLYDSINRQNTQ